MATTTATLIGKGAVAGLTPGQSIVPAVGDSFLVLYNGNGDPSTKDEYPDLINIQQGGNELLFIFKHEADAPNMNGFNGQVTGVNNNIGFSLGDPVAIYREPSQGSMSYVSVELQPSLGGTNWVTGGVENFTPAPTG